MAAFDFKTATPASASASALIFGAESQSAATPSIYNTTGSGTVVLNTSATLVTPTIGVATATSINKVAITAPASSATLTIANGKTFTCSNTLTFTGTDSSSVAFGAGGTVLYSGGALGTPSSGTLTNCSGLPISGIASLGTGVGTALAVNVGSAGAFVTFNGALGTPSSGTLTNATGLPISTGVSGLGTGVATFLATPSSANLAAAVTDETGTGALVFANSPTFTDDITLGTQQTTQGSIILANTAAGAYATTIQSSNSASAAWTLTLPTTAGTNGQVLATNGFGVTSWVAAGSGSPGGSTTEVQFNDGGAFAGDSVFVWDKTNNRLGVNKASPSVTLEVGTFNTSSSNILTGSLALQPYSLNNGWIAENAYYNGSAWKYRSTGYAGLFYFNTGEGQFRFYNTGTGGNDLSPASGNTTQFKVRYDGKIAFGGLGSESPADFNNFTAVATSSAFTLASSKTLGWVSSTDPSASPDTMFTRGSAGIVALRGSSSTTPGALNLYTYGASPPSAPSASMALLYADTSGGKIRLMALFPSGAAQQIAIEP